MLHENSYTASIQTNFCIKLCLLIIASHHHQQLWSCRDARSPFYSGFLPNFGCKQLMFNIWIADLTSFPGQYLDLASCGHTCVGVSEWRSGHISACLSVEYRSCHLLCIHHFSIYKVYRITLETPISAQCKTVFSLDFIVTVCHFVPLKEYFISFPMLSKYFISFPMLSK